MKSLKLQFNGLQGWQLLAEEVNGLVASAQVALANFACLRGENPFSPDAGTDLLQAGVSGLITDPMSAKHQANFAAAETREMINNNTPGDTALSFVALELVQLAPPRLDLNAVFQLADEQYGVSLTA